MTEIESKTNVMKAIDLLYERGLVFGRSGSVSCRIDEHSFVITPNQIDFAKPDIRTIVVVDIKTQKHSGVVEPSNETNIHALAYQLSRSTSFVIHTHQKYASCVSVAGIEAIEPSEPQQEMLNTKVMLSPYAVVGSKAYIKNLQKVLESQSKAILIERHGALVVGADMTTAFNRALALEHVSKKVLHDMEFSDIAFSSISQRVGKKMFNYTNVENTENIEESRNDVVDDPKLVGIKFIHAKLMEALPKYNIVVCRNSEATNIVSRQTDSIDSLLYEFSEKIGEDIKLVSRNDIEELIKATKKRGAVIVKNVGVFAFAKDYAEAVALLAVVEKNIIAYLNATKYNAKTNLTRFEKWSMMKGIKKESKNRARKK